MDKKKESLLPYFPSQTLAHFITDHLSGIIHLLGIPPPSSRHGPASSKTKHPKCWATDQRSKTKTIARRCTHPLLQCHSLSKATTKFPSTISYRRHNRRERSRRWQRGGDQPTWILEKGVSLAQGILRIGDQHDSSACEEEIFFIFSRKTIGSWLCRAQLYHTQRSKAEGSQKCSVSKPAIHNPTRDQG